MTLEDLRAFATAYDAGSFSEAARQLCCTQAAVAQHIRKLEQQLGGELFSRQRRGIKPTPLGELLYRGTGGALRDIDATVKRIRESVKSRGTSLRFATAPNIATRYLRRAIRRLGEVRPDARVEIVHASTAEERIDALRAGRADLTTIPFAGRSMQSLEVRPMARVPLGLMVSRSHPFAERAGLELSELGGIRYIAQGPSSGTFLHLRREFRSVGMDLVPSAYVEDAASAALMVELGTGETFCPLSATRSVERSGRLRVIPVPSLAPIRMVWVSRDFSLLPEVALEFVRLTNQLSHDSRPAGHGPLEEP